MNEITRHFIVSVFLCHAIITSHKKRHWSWASNTTGPPTPVFANIVHNANIITSSTTAEATNGQTLVYVPDQPFYRYMFCPSK